MKKNMTRYAYLGLLGLGFANWVAWSYVLEGTSLKVTFFDVGQGDAIFIETRQGHQILIDGGPDRKVQEKVARAMPFWDKSLDLLILTHPDADHITGLVGVLEQYVVGDVLWTGIEKDTSIFRLWKQRIEEEGARITLVRSGQHFIWTHDSDGGVLQILYPDHSAIAETKAVNDTSIVTKLVFGSHSFLFPGDITKAVEQHLVQSGINLDADVLKVPHHGSKTSSSEAFLTAVSPRIAVIQVGAKNRYGHPAEEVLSRFLAFGIPILRTDVNGDIVIQYEPSKTGTYISDY